MANENATVHNPSNFQPENYEILDYLDNKRPEYFGQSVEVYAQEVKWWESEMVAVLGADWRRKIGHCVHCGNGRVRWITAVLHVPTGERVVFGADCTARLGFANQQEFKLAQLQARDKARAVRVKVYRAYMAYLESHPEIAQAVKDIAEPVHANNTFAKDVLGKLGQYGSLSDKQAAAVVASMARDHEYAARKAAEAVEVKGDAPSGRVEVSGVVVSVKDFENEYGFCRKMTIKLANNSAVWMTVPSGANVERGDKVTVKATFTVSDRDKAFGFGKRPIVLANEGEAARAAAELVAAV